jgi:NADH-quinone oxidoreductase subunit M
MYLSAIIFLPVIGAIIIALIRGLSEKGIRWISAIFTFIPLALSIYLFAIFDRTQAALGTMQFEETLSWIPAINANYHLGVDGISLPLVILMTLLGFLVV